MPGTPVSLQRRGCHGPPLTHQHLSRWQGALGEGTKGVTGLLGAGGPGAAPCAPAPLTQHIQRVQPCVFARAVSGQAGVCPRVGGLEPLEEQGAAIRGHPAWGGQGSDLRVHP